ncbi:MAG: hypothetical protein OEU36_22635 [Gammaproteobacteria bacterium]|nr:hypothetical protein [Gammaproteobacteria bacterium]
MRFLTYQKPQREYGVSVLICGAWVLLLMLPLLVVSVAVSAAQPRVLIIAIDAIPYGVAKQVTDPNLGEAAIFKGFKGPAAVISSFPSTSHLAWTGILQPFDIPKAKGYEARYFNTHTHKVQGGLGLGSISAPWKEFFDWRVKGLIRKTWAYGRPRSYGPVELRRGLKAFSRSEDPVFAFYIVSTDALGHTAGPEALGEFLKKLDHSLTVFKQDHPSMPFYTVLISDHGMSGGEPLKNSWPAVQKRLRQEGFRTSRRLSNENSIVIIAYGLVSSFVAYTNQGKELLAASAISSVPGVDMCAIQMEHGYRVVSARGDAFIEQIETDGQMFWSYETLTGDPLGYAGVIDSMHNQSGKKQNRWFPDDWWFESTKHSKYPDALYRIAQSFELVQSPSSVSCSVSEGYMFGARKTEIAALPTVGKLRWTHGALHASASLGFLMSDLPQWQAPDVVRFDEALAPFAGLPGKLLSSDVGH